MTDNTAAVRMARLRDRKRAAGLAEVVEWVPPDRIPELRQMAEQMRKAIHARQNQPITNVEQEEQPS